jgi:hypothetical protein
MGRMLDAGFESTSFYVYSLHEKLLFIYPFFGYRYLACRLVIPEKPPELQLCGSYFRDDLYLLPEGTCYFYFSFNSQ